jgi:streptomycin 6-kinase
MIRKAKNFRLGERDSAIVFYDSGDVRIMIPKEEKGKEAPSSAVIASAIAMLFSNEPRAKTLLGEVEKLFETLYNEKFSRGTVDGDHTNRQDAETA